MCGRYTLTTPVEDLVEHLDLDREAEQELIDLALAPRYNVAPSQEVLIVATRDGRRAPRRARWGLVPSFVQDPRAIGARWINARAETAATLPAFRAAFRRRRCLVPADGFYEWKREPGRAAKTPWRLQLAGGGPCAFAGLWERWRGADGAEIVSCAVLTTAPNALVAAVHDRMPAILPRERYAAWLREDAPVDALAALLEPFPADRMEAWPVSTLVNRPAFDDPLCLERAAADGDDPRPRQRELWG